MNKLVLKAFLVSYNFIGSIMAMSLEFATELIFYPHKPLSPEGKKEVPYANTGDTVGLTFSRLLYTDATQLISDS